MHVLTAFVLITFHVACYAGPLPAELRVRRQVELAVPTLPICTPAQLNELNSCESYVEFGFCKPDSLFFSFALQNCFFSCGFCQRPPTTSPPTTAPPICLADTLESCEAYLALGLCGPDSFLRDFLAVNCNATCGNCIPTTTMPPTTTEATTTIALTTEATTTMAPTTEATTTMAPTTEATTTMEPTTEANTTMAPTTEATTTMAPTTEATTTMEATTEANTTMEPTTEANTTMAPTTEATTTMAPTTEATTTMEATTEAATTVAEDACLQAHNDKRALHGTSALIWNSTLAQHAQEWAEYLVSINDLQHERNIDEGENLYASVSQVQGTCAQAVESWYSEVSLYDFQNPPTTPQEFFDMGAGHFTQVVWNATTSVGAGLATIGPDASGAIQTYIVARYYPQGNILGVFGQNVFEPVGP